MLSQWGTLWLSPAPFAGAAALAVIVSSRARTSPQSGEVFNATSRAATNSLV